MTKYFPFRKQQTSHSTPASKAVSPDELFTRALEGTLAPEWLSKADESAYRDL